MPSDTMRLRKNEYFFTCFLNNRTSTPSASKAAFTSFQMSQKHWANVYQNLCQNRREPTSQMKGLRGRFAVSCLQGFFRCCSLMLNTGVPYHLYLFDLEGAQSKLASSPAAITGPLTTMPGFLENNNQEPFKLLHSTIPSEN